MIKNELATWYDKNNNAQIGLRLEMNKANSSWVRVDDPIKALDRGDILKRNHDKRFLLSSDNILLGFPRQSFLSLYIKKVSFSSTSFLLRKSRNAEAKSEVENENDQCIGDFRTFSNLKGFERSVRTSQELVKMLICKDPKLILRDGVKITDLYTIVEMQIIADLVVMGSGIKDFAKACSVVKDVLNSIINERIPSNYDEMIDQHNRFVYKSHDKKPKYLSLDPDFIYACLVLAGDIKASEHRPLEPLVDWIYISNKFKEG